MAKRLRVPLIAGAFLNFVLDGEEKLHIPITKIANSIKDLRRFWIEYWAPAFFANVQRNFASQGGLVGGWRALSPEYAAWKFAHYGRKPILVRTNAMRESFKIGGRNSVLIATRTRVEAGSRDRKVPYHQAGTARMPRRQIVVALTGRSTSMLLNRFVRDEMQRAGMKVA